MDAARFAEYDTAVALAAQVQTDMVQLVNIAMESDGASTEQKNDAAKALMNVTLMVARVFSHYRVAQDTLQLLEYCNRFSLQKDVDQLMADIDTNMEKLEEISKRVKAEGDGSDYDKAQQILNESGIY